MQRSLHFFCTDSSISTGTIPDDVVRSLLRTVTATDLNLDVRCVELSVPCSLGNDSGVCQLEHWLGLSALFLWLRVSSAPLQSKKLLQHITLIMHVVAHGDGYVWRFSGSGRNCFCSSRRFL